MQAGGMCHRWRSPNGNFNQVFVKLDLDCEPDKSSGVVIATDKHYEQAFATPVENLYKELHALLRQQIQESPIIYWWPVQDKNKIKRILYGLTKRPIFTDRR